MHTIDILDRICPEEAGLPPSARTWARLTAIQGGFSVLEIRDPNDGPGDPAASTRHQYLIWPPDGDEPHLWRRRLPPAPLDAPPVKQIVYCGGRDAWADADRAAAWELVEPSATSLPWAWATAQGVRTYVRIVGDVRGDVRIDGDVGSRVVIDGAVSGDVVIAGDVGSRVSIDGDIAGDVRIGGDVGSRVTIRGDVSGGVTIDGDVRGDVRIAGDVRGTVEVSRDETIVAAARADHDRILREARDTEILALRRALVEGRVDGSRPAARHSMAAAAVEWIDHYLSAQRQP